METKTLCDGLELSAADNMEYVVAYHEKESPTSGVAVKVNGLNFLALATAVIVNVLEEIRDPWVQACFFRAMFDTIKEQNVLNPIVDMAVSYNCKVLRSEKDR